MVFLVLIKFMETIRQKLKDSKDKLWNDSLSLGGAVSGHAYNAVFNHLVF